MTPVEGRTARRDRWIVVAIVVLTVLLLGYNVLMFYGPSFLLKGRRVETLTLFNVERGIEEQVPLPEGVVFLHFWATWCSSCVAELPLLTPYVHRATIIGILKEPIRLDHLRSFSVPWRNYRGTDPIFSSFMITGVPATVLVRDRVVRAAHMGPLSREVIESWLNESY